MSYSQLAVNSDHTLASDLSERLDYEMKKQRLMFRFYRDYFSSKLAQEKLKDNPFQQSTLRKILEAIRQEFKNCLYPMDSKVLSTGQKFQHMLLIQDHLDQLEYIKNS